MSFNRRSEVIGGKKFVSLGSPIAGFYSAGKILSVHLEVPWRKDFGLENS